MGELSGSLIRMAATLHPTFFVAVISAHYSEGTLTAARRYLEGELRRHCHIFDRSRIEGLLGANLSAIKPILDAGLSRLERDRVLTYLAQRSASLSVLHVEPQNETTALAGEPFRVAITIEQLMGVDPDLRIAWRPPAMGQIALIAPPGADARHGAKLPTQSDAGTDFTSRIELEFLTYCSGAHSLGAIELLREGRVLQRLDLPRVKVRPNLHPPFFAAPYQEQIAGVEEAFARALSGRPTIAAVLGAAGTGKTRLCEEMALAARREGALYASIEQPSSHEQPHRLFGDLLIALADERLGHETPGERVVRTLARFDASFAERVRTDIIAFIDSQGSATGDEQPLLSAGVLLLVAQSRSRPLFLHLQNMHWCAVDSLALIEKLLWQLDNAAGSTARVLVLLEGRLQAQGPEDTWSSRPFETLVERQNCKRLIATPSRRAKVETLWIGCLRAMHTAHRLISDSMIPTQRDAVRRIHAAAGGSPFLVLELARLLLHQSVLATNPSNGQLRTLRPLPAGPLLPATAAEAIRSRWLYWSKQDPPLGRLLLALAKFDDRISAPLFKHLRARLAPELADERLAGVEMLAFTGPGATSGVSFRHETYFKSCSRWELRTHRPAGHGGLPRLVCATEKTDAPNCAICKRAFC